MRRVVMDVAVGAMQVGRVAPGCRRPSASPCTCTSTRPPPRRSARSTASPVASARCLRTGSGPRPHRGPWRRPARVQRAPWCIPALEMARTSSSPKFFGTRTGKVTIRRDRRRWPCAPRGCDDRFRRIASHRLGALAAVKLRSACEQQLQVIVQLRHRADRAARGAHGIGLIDRDRGRHASM